jgi:hypothetical protein
VVVDNEFSTGSTRRRTNAYTFDPDIYAQWSGGVGVWLKDEHDPKDAPDENNYAAFLHNCCNFDACCFRPLVFDPLDKETPIRF